MKFNLFYKFSFYKVIFFIIHITFSNSLSANIDQELKNIASKLRCMTCQNQTIYSSDADFSLIIKKIIKQKLENNESEEKIINFLIYRYGEYIVFEPQKDIKNIFLWLFPFVILVLCLIFLSFRIKKVK